MTRFAELLNCSDFSTASPDQQPLPLGGRYGRAAREFSQGASHAKQGRIDLLGISDDYDAGYRQRGMVTSQNKPFGQS